MAEPNVYARGKIYKIVRDGTDQIYVGHTTEPRLSRRMNGHRSDFCSWKAGKRKYCSSFAMLDGGPCRIVLIEDFPCQNIDQLKAREQHYIDLFKPICVNIQRAIDLRTDDERRADKSQSDARYRAANRDAIRVKDAEYRAANRDAIRVKDAQFRAANRDAIRVKDAEVVACECGANVSRGCLSRHKKRQKHIQQMAALAVQ